MRVLFICKANVGRSQTAMTFYNALHPNMAGSAGTVVDKPGEILADRFGAIGILEVMREEYGLDMSNNTRAQLTEELARSYDKLIVMAQPETIPEWLKNDPRAERWNIDDPRQQDPSATSRIVAQIKQHVEQLANA